MSNTKLDPNPFKQAIKDRKEGVLLGPVTIDNLLAMGAELYDGNMMVLSLTPPSNLLATVDSNTMRPTELPGEFIDNVENQA